MPTHSPRGARVTDTVSTTGTKVCSRKSTSQLTPLAESTMVRSRATASGAS
jgi:hypothetical protein